MKEHGDASHRIEGHSFSDFTCHGEASHGKGDTIQPWKKGAQLPQPGTAGPGQSRVFKTLKRVQLTQPDTPGPVSPCRGQPWKMVCSFPGLAL